MSDKNKETKLNEEKIEEQEIKNESTAGAPQDAPEANNTEEAQEKDELTAITRERDELKDQLLRKAAEFENYRKRTLKEKTELILNGGENVIKALLPIIDDFDRAMENINKSDNIDTLKEGLSLILSKFNTALNSQGLKKIETKDQDFNTDFHEAIALIPATEDAQKGKVIDCTQAGYTLNDKVIRHAKVVVAQ